MVENKSILQYLESRHRHRVAPSVAHFLCVVLYILTVSSAALPNLWLRVILLEVYRSRALEEEWLAPPYNTSSPDSWPLVPYQLQSLQPIVYTCLPLLYQNSKLFQFTSR